MRRRSSTRSGRARRHAGEATARRRRRLRTTDAPPHGRPTDDPSAGEDRPRPEPRRRGDAILPPCPTASRRPVRRSCASTRSASATASSAPAWPARRDAPDGWWLTIAVGHRRRGRRPLPRCRPGRRTAARPAAGSPRSVASRAPSAASSSRTPADSSSASAPSSRPTTRPVRGACRWRSARPSDSSRRAPRDVGRTSSPIRCSRAFRRAVEGLPAVTGRSRSAGTC